MNEEFRKCGLPGLFAVLLPVVFDRLLRPPFARREQLVAKRPLSIPLISAAAGLASGRRNLRLLPDYLVPDRQPTAATTPSI